MTGERPPASREVDAINQARMPTARPADPHAQLRIDIDLLAADPDAVVREHADPAIGSRHPDVAVSSLSHWLFENGRRRLYTGSAPRTCASNALGTT